MTRLPTVTAAAGVALALMLTACGKTIDSDAAADTVAKVVAEESGFDPQDVSCPEDVDAEEGGTFDCEFTGPDGDYVAHVTIQEVDGDTAVFGVEAVPAGR